VLQGAGRDAMLTVTETSPSPMKPLLRQVAGHRPRAAERLQVKLRSAAAKRPSGPRTLVHPHDDVRGPDCGWPKAIHNLRQLQRFVRRPFTKPRIRHSEALQGILPGCDLLDLMQSFVHSVLDIER